MSAYRPLFVDAEEAIRRDSEQERRREAQRRLKAALDSIPFRGPVAEARLRAWTELWQAGFVRPGMTLGLSDLLRDP